MQFLSWIAKPAIIPIASATGAAPPENPDDLMSYAFAAGFQLTPPLRLGPAARPQDEFSRIREEQVSVARSGKISFLGTLVSLTNWFRAFSSGSFRSDPLCAQWRNRGEKRANNKTRMES